MKQVGPGARLAPKAVASPKSQSRVKQALVKLVEEKSFVEKPPIVMSQSRVKQALVKQICYAEFLSILINNLSQSRVKQALVKQLNPILEHANMGNIVAIPR